MYMLLIRPQQRKMKEQQALVQRAASGDRVMLASGIYGTLTEVLDTSAYIEVADGIEMLVLRSAIQEILDEFPTGSSSDDSETDDTEADDTDADDIEADDDSAEAEA